MTYRSLMAGVGLGSAIALSAWFPAVAQPQIVLPRSRATEWLELETANGEVTFQPYQQAAQPAQKGNRLTDIGDIVQTGDRSYAQLSFDRDIGSVLVWGNAILRVDVLDVEATGGRITHLSVPQGIAKLQVRRFNNPNSSLTVTTPAGIAGVRGTVFGVGVDPNGKTAVATEEGAVAVSGVGETVQVDPEFYSLIQPGEPPLPPQPLAETDLDVELRRLVPISGVGTTTPSVRLAARVHPINLVYANGIPTSVDLEGNIEAEIPLDSDRRLTFTVLSPLGDERTYELSVPNDGWDALPPEQSE
ncbi:MAG: FecR family protein [Cyanobacteria bacterium P01_D01_bin.123]